MTASEHWWDLINFESILFLSSLTVCFSKTVKYLTCSSKWHGELRSLSRRLYFFPVPEEIVYSFFDFLFDILELYKFGLCITACKPGFSFWLYFYLSKRVSTLILDMGFFANLQLFCPIWSY